MNSNTHVSEKSIWPSITENINWMYAWKSKTLRRKKIYQQIEIDVVQIWFNDQLVASSECSFKMKNRLGLV